jgi:predicted  nucleic acid-binding Zn-ribbon protein
MYQYVIGDSDLEPVDVINDLSVLVDNRMTFVNHIESIVLKNAGMYKVNFKETQ